MRQMMITMMAAAVVLGGFAMLHSGLDVQPTSACQSGQRWDDPDGVVKMCEGKDCVTDDAQHDLDGAVEMCQSQDCVAAPFPDPTLEPAVILDDKDAAQGDRDGAVRMCDGGKC